MEKLTRLQRLVIDSLQNGCKVEKAATAGKPCYMIYRESVYLFAVWTAEAIIYPETVKILARLGYVSHKDKEVILTEKGANYVNS